ncbi:transcriptional regulator [Methylobacillus arboreus]|uniref:transcriptional regulator n=1 Tax=Methylobacillus arboreus TaxID=755170 RepID=UPI001E41CAAA|nr:transcriptional regulator [Methylobacillus arboreus]MCB5190666.1 transcriptional regulator [Methylobacillus arboreus]
MKLQITTMAELGEVIRATRKANHIRLDDMAGMAGVGPVFVGDVEYGKETVQMGRVLQLLRELGLKLTVDVPLSTEPYLQKIRQQGGLVRPSKRKTQRSIKE